MTQKLVDYFYILTVTWNSSPGNVEQHTSSGTARLLPGNTAEESFKVIFDARGEELGFTEKSAAVLFYHLERQ